MSVLVDVNCPHCQADSAAGAFCESCGMALPALERVPPRVVGPADFAQSGVGRQLQSDALRSEASTAAKALMWVAIIQTGVLAYIVIVLAGKLPPDKIAQNVVVIAQAVSAGIFWGLFFWARVQPLPAAIVGLALYVTLVVINMVTAIGRLSDGHGRSNGVGGVGIGWIDIVIMLILARAISSGLKFRKLSDSEAAA